METDIKQALTVLYNGGIILYPTDTIWGLGCDATNPQAVDSIFKIKQRTDSKSLIVLLSNINSINRYIDSPPQVALDIIEMATKPTTIIFCGAKNIAQNAINKADNTIAIRIPNDPFCQKLLMQFRKPIISTSANISGQPAPENFAQITSQITQNVDYIVKHRQNEPAKAKPSSIIKINNDNTFTIIRQ